MKKIGKKTIQGLNGKKLNLKPFEDELPLTTFLEYHDKGRTIGASLLEKGKNAEAFRVVFAFRSRGIPPIMSPTQLQNVINGFYAFNDIAPDETITIIHRCFRDDKKRQYSLDSLLEGQNYPQLQYLVASEAAKAKGLTEKGDRQIDELIIFVTATYGEEGTQINKGDFFDQFLVAVEKNWFQIIGSYAQIKVKAIEEILIKAFNMAYLRWENLLKNQIGFDIIPLNLVEFQQEILRRFDTNFSFTSRLNHVIIDLSTKTFSEKVITENSPLAYCIAQSVPKSQRDYIQIKDSYIGVLTINEKPDLGEEELRLYYLYEILTSEQVYDIEIISQIKLGNYAVMMEKLQLLSKQSVNAAALSEEQGEINVGAAIRLDEQIEAQKALFQSEKPFHVATIVLVYRNNLGTLKRECEQLSSLFKKMSWISREEDYAWKVWLQSFPQLSWERLLTKPFARTLTYLTSELPIAAPVVGHRSSAQEGLEFLSDQGGNPIYFDIFKQHNHFGIFAASGAGKSVLLSDIAFHALFYGMPSTILEVGRDDGTGSFDGLCNFLPRLCSYVAIGKTNTGWNLMQPPSLKKFDEEARQDRFQEFLRDLLQILVVLVMGYENKVNDVNKDVVSSLLQLALKKFYEDAIIANRFAAAFTYGLGSKEWSGMPTLLDFLGFCSLERLNIAEQNNQIVTAINFIKVRFRALFESSLGGLLTRTTTFDTNSLMLVVSMAGIRDDTDAFVIGSLSYLGARRRALQFPESFFLIDEVNLIARLDPIAAMIGESYANGRKSGIRVGVSGQGIGDLFSCRGGKDIANSMAIKITGKLQPQALSQYVDYLGYPADLISENASDRYGINKQRGYSRWLFDCQGLTQVRHYPNPALMCLVSNSPKESRVRDKFWQDWEGDPVSGLHELVNVFPTLLSGVKK
jgi:hypothetical protein